MISRALTLWSHRSRGAGFPLTPAAVYKCVYNSLLLRKSDFVSGYPSVLIAVAALIGFDNRFIGVMIGIEAGRIYWNPQTLGMGMDDG